MGFSLVMDRDAMLWNAGVVLENVLYEHGVLGGRLSQPEDQECHTIST
jgi:hypothetical protein